MKKLAFIVDLALGHIARASVIARALLKTSNVEISFLFSNENNFARKVLRDDFDFYPMPYEPGPLQLHSFARELERILSKQSFDALCFDMNPLYWISTAKLPDIPQAMITNVFLTNLADKATMQTELFATHSAAINEVRHSKGLPALRDPKELYERDRIVLADPRFVVEHFAKLPDHYRSAGAVFWSADDPLPAELSNIERALLLSLGSTGLRNPPAEMVQYLSTRFQCDRIVQVGGQMSDGTRADYIDHHYRWLAVEKLLPKCELVITAGGVGSTYMSLAQGVPVVCFPYHKNHRIFADVMEDIGVAVSLNPKDWQTKLEAVDFSALQNNARRLMPEFNSVQAARSAAAYIRELLE